MAEGPGGKRAGFLAGEIEREIARRGWPVGAVLGGEEALCQRYGVSRAVLREAIRILESRWVARMRPGPGGGLVVTAPDAAAVRDLVGMYLGFKQAAGTDLAESWLALELAAVGRVADDADEAAVTRLREVLTAPPGTPWQEQVRHLHGTIAELSGNAALELFIDVLSTLTLEHHTSPDGPGEAWLAEQHEALVAAIVAGDSGLAQHRLRRYVKALVAPTGER